MRHFLSACPVATCPRSMGEPSPAAGLVVDEATHHQRRDIIYDVHQHLLLERRVHGPPYAWIIEWLPLGIDPGRIDHALVEPRRGHPRGGGGLADGRRIERAGVIHPPRQDGRPEFG